MHKALLVSCVNHQIALKQRQIEYIARQTLFYFDFRLVFKHFQSLFARIQIFKIGWLVVKFSASTRRILKTPIPQKHVQKTAFLRLKKIQPYLDTFFKKPLQRKRHFIVPEGTVILCGREWRFRNQREYRMVTGNVPRVGGNSDWLCTTVNPFVNYRIQLQNFF